MIDRVNNEEKNEMVYVFDHSNSNKRETDDVVDTIDNNNNDNNEQSTRVGSQSTGVQLGIATFKVENIDSWMKGRCVKDYSKQEIEKDGISRQ